MTVSNTTTKNKLSTNGVTVDFPFTFYLTNTNQVLCKLVDPVTEAETDYTNFTVVKAGDNNGGTVTTLDVLNNTDLLIFRDTPLTQETDYVKGGRFPADSHEAALDKLTLQNQEQQEEIDRTIKVSIGADVTPTYEDIDGRITTAQDTADEAIAIANTALEYGEAQAPIALNGGIWAIGQTYTVYNEYMIYNGEAYSPLPATALPYTVGAAPDLGFVYQIKLNSLQALSGLTEASDLDNVHTRTFATVAAMKEFGGFQEGQRINWQGYYAQSDGGGNWGIIKTGAHTEDGGSIFSIDANTYVEANLKSKVSVLKFGVIRNTPSSDLVTAAANLLTMRKVVAYCIANHYSIYAPSGEYIVDVSNQTTNVSQAITIDFTEDGQSFILLGDGKGITVFKDADGCVDRSIPGIRKFIKTWQIDTPNSINIERILVKGVTFDKNGDSNAAPAAPFDLEQCHVFDWQSSNWGSIAVTCKSIQFIDHEILDMIAGGLHLATQADVGEFIVDGFHGDGQPSGKFGFRSDIEPTLFCDNQTIKNSRMVSLQNEPVTGFEPTTLKPRKYFIENCIIDVLQIASTSEVSGPDPRALEVNLNNVRVKTEYSVRSGIVNASYCKLKFRISIWGPLQNYYNCDLLFDEVAGTSVPVLLEPRETGEFNFERCKFILDAVGTATGTQLKAGALVAGQTPDYFSVNINDCTTSEFVTDTFSAAGSGTFKVKDSNLRNNGGTICVIGSLTTQGDVTFENNKMPDVNGTYFFNDQGFTSNLNKLTFIQELDLDLMVSNNQSIDRSFSVITGATGHPRLTGYKDGDPTALNLQSWRGTKIYPDNPVAAGFEGWVCVTSGKPGVWKQFGAISA